jgi:hypothetical protein
MIYRGSGILAVVFHDPPLLHVHNVSRLDRHTGRLRKRENLLTGEGEGVGEGSKI